MLDEADIEHPTLKRLFAYWNQKRGTREFPSRADLDPLDFPYALGSVTLIDVLPDPRRFRYRLVGTKLVEEYGFDLTRRWVDEFPLPEMRQMLLATYEEVVANRAPHHYFRDTVKDGRTMRHEGLVAPLGEGDAINMLLICLVARGRS